MRERKSCPNPDHSDGTPSCVRYDDSWYCFGCQKRFALVEGEKMVAVTKVIPEDINEKITYIKNLPKAGIRGLKLPADGFGYYIVWPDSSYYKCRRWDIHLHNSSMGNKYISPSGYTPKWFEITKPEATRLVIVEGEINALSINELGLDWDIASPGSATLFKDNKKCKLNFIKYTTVVIIIDNDKAGFEAGIALRAYIKELNPFVHVYSMGEDCNDILNQHGKERLKEELRKMGVS